jgi:uncharacterized protein (DUF1800 family)
VCAVNRALALPLIIPMLQTEIAVMRFGLGARPGDLQAAAADPRGWLRAQTQGAVALTGAGPLTPSDQIIAAALAAREERRERKRDSAAPAAAAEANALPVLADLATHPSTAHFIATKLVRHFVADDPPAAAVERVTRAYRESGGELPRVYAALIDAPEAWDAQLRKFKTPEDFVFSTLRALEAAPQKSPEVIRSFELLGQRQYTPGSPAGWADTAKSWDGPDALMHRVLWASRVAERFEKGQSALDLAASCLGGFARPETLAALKRAASGSQALALLLMSPEFQRR